MSLESSTEETIRKAIERGEFDNLKGQGKPLDLTAYFNTREDLRMVGSGYVPPVERTDIIVLGESAQAAMKLALHMMKRGGFISDHDELIGKKLANVMSGGTLNHQTQVSERYLLDLEREAFVSLCGERRTQERIAAILKTNKPLRN